MEANLGCIGLYRSFFVCGAAGVISKRRGCAAILRPAPCWAVSTGLFFFIWGMVLHTQNEPRESQSTGVLRTIYGLSLTASFVCASATRRLASATRRDKSSDTPGVPGVPGVDTPEGGVARAGVAGFEGAGKAAPEALLFIAAIFAAISALFWAMIASFCSRT